VVTGPSRLLAILGPTATGKSALAIAMAERFDGEIVSCDSTAVYRGFDIGTDKVPAAEQRGIPHHLVDVVEPNELYSAARYASDATRAIEEIEARGRLPILAGGTGFYYRALRRGLFPGPARDAALRARLERVEARRGPGALHRWVTRVDPESGARIQSRDVKRLIRALEVYLLTGQPLSAHFAATESLLKGFDIMAVGLRAAGTWHARRLRARVDDQFARGLLDEIRSLLEAGTPPTAPPFGGLVYRQALEHLHGVRDEAATRELIARENRRYARRQLIWFRKEPNLLWFDAADDMAATIETVGAHVATWLGRQSEMAADPRSL
jgi:tRNA dimethylallyltransferase